MPLVNASGSVTNRFGRLWRTVHNSSGADPRCRLRATVSAVSSLSPCSALFLASPHGFRHFQTMTPFPSCSPSGVQFPCGRLLPTQATKPLYGPQADADELLERVAA